MKLTYSPLFVWSFLGLLIDTATAQYPNSTGGYRSKDVNKCPISYLSPGGTATWDNTVDPTFVAGCYKDTSDPKSLYFTSIALNDCLSNSNGNLTWSAQ